MFRAVTAALLAVLFAVQAQATGRLFVVSKGKRALEVYNPDTGQKEFEVVVQGALHEVALSPDGRFAYVGDYEGVKNTLTEIDVNARAISASLVLTPNFMPHGLVVTRDGSKLYATCAASHSLVEVALHPMKVNRAFKVFADNTDIIALSPDEKLLYASSSIEGNFAVIDLVKGDFERSILSGNGCEGIAVSPDGSEIWLANRVSQTLVVVDVASRRKVQAIPCVGNPMRIYFTPDGKQAVVTCAVAGRLAIFDRATRAETGRFVVGEFPVEIAFSGEGKPAYVTNAKANEVAVVDLATKSVLRRIPVGPDPEGVAYSE
jgi:YVTN family beta-propeller protein